MDRYGIVRLVRFLLMFIKRTDLIYCESFSGIDPMPKTTFPKEYHGYDENGPAKHQHSTSNNILA